MVYQRPVVTPDNRGPLIEFSSYLLLTTSILTTVIKLATKFIVARALRSDDWFAIAALAFATGQCIAVFQQVKGGLGRHEEALTTRQVDGFQKAGYVVELQYILSIALAKVVTLRFLATLARDKYNKLWIKIVMTSNAMWALLAFLGVAFQCRVPDTWKITSGVCFNRLAFWSFVSLTDIVVDISITILPAVILYNIRMAWMKKANAVTAFAGRLLVIPVTILRLVYIFSSNNSLDPTFDSFNTVLATVIATNFSIIVACISFIKPFLDNIETGQLASRLRNQGMGTAQYPSRKTKLEYAKNLFRPRGQSSEERQFPLIAGAQKPSGSSPVYELSNITSGQTSAEAVP